MKSAKLRLEDIKVGDIVSETSLSHIYIRLVNSKIFGEDIVGRIAYIGRKLN